MEGGKYSLRWNSSDFAYEFYSEGPKGRIKKQLKFQPIPKVGENVFNVALGDQDQVTGDFNDLAISNNNDRVKVINTVAEAIIGFLDFKPNAILHIQGNTSSRTRLYQMALFARWWRIEHSFEVLGKLGNDWLSFRKGVNYERFLVYKKNE
jgi:hypothetical protein